MRFLLLLLPLRCASDIAAEVSASGAASSAAFSFSSWEEPLSSLAAVPPPPREGMRFEPLHEGGVYVAEQFLSDAEVAHLVAMASRNGWSASPTGGDAYELPSDPEAYRASQRNDAIVRRIERRIADATGIPPHAHEDCLSVARIRTRGRVPSGGHFPPFGLHHDSDGRPFRALTVIMYLTTVPESEGGMTIFPLLYAPTGSTSARRHASFTEAIQAHYSGRSNRWQRHVSFDPAAAHPYNALLSGACRGRHGVAVRPVRGRAIMFEQRRVVNGTENRDTWHAGCNIVTPKTNSGERGDAAAAAPEKIILQKFKELPLGERPERDQRIQFPYKSCF